MIVSHTYRFIFLKTNKTAGTSIEIALSKFCGPGDIITPISPEDEAIRRGLGYPGPSNHEAPLSDYGLSDLALRLFKGRRKQRYYNHISAGEAMVWLGRDVWDSYFKFCFERNPWDRMVSLYYWRCQTEPRPSFAEFVASGLPGILKQRGRDLYTVDGRRAVDRVCRFEDLATELEAIRCRLGIPEPLGLPRTKAGHRKVKGYRELYGEREREIVAEMFADEIKELGYAY